MCGRYSLIHTGRLSERYGVSEETFFEPVYNAAPGFIMPIVVKGDVGGNKIMPMKWGLIPHWAKDYKIGYSTINARAETLNKTPAFREPFKNKRCLIPFDGFFEWKRDKTAGQPYYIKMKNSELLSFAGVYDRWTDVEGKTMKSYSIITTEPNKTLKSIHNRMPAILDRGNEEVWLSESSRESDLQDLLKPYESSGLETYPVSKSVNNPRNRGPEIIEQAGQ